MSCNPNRFDAVSHPGQWLLVVMLLLAILMLPASAGTATKAGSGTDLTSAGVGAWSGGSGANGSPTSADVATWTSSSLGAGLTIGSASSWGSINVTGSSSASIAITGSGALTLGASGITIASSAVDMSIGNPITLGAPQTWTIGSGRTLTCSGITTGSAANICTKDGSGTLIKSSGSDAVVNTVIAAGTLSGKPSTQAGSVTIAKNGTWDLYGGNRVTATIADGTGGGGVITISTATPETLSTGNSTADTSFSGVLQNGAGTLSLNKQNY